MDLQGKRIIVTGAGSGIGRAIAERLAADGAAVTGIDREVAGCDELVAAGTLVGRQQADVTKAGEVEQAVTAAVADMGGLDALVNNAGIEILGGIDELTEEQWDLQFDVNVKSIFLVTKAALPALLADGGGAVVNTASDVGLGGEIGIDAYVASKHAVVGLTKCLALTWARKGLRVNAICPGTTMTPLTERHFAGAGGDEKSASRSIPIGRLARPHEIAAGVSFLLSPDASYINGTMFLVDGGATAGPFSVEALKEEQRA